MIEIKGKLPDSFCDVSITLTPNQTSQEGELQNNTTDEPGCKFLTKILTSKIQQYIDRMEYSAAFRKQAFSKEWILFLNRWN